MKPGKEPRVGHPVIACLKGGARNFPTGPTLPTRVLKYGYLDIIHSFRVTITAAVGSQSTIFQPLYFQMSFSNYHGTINAKSHRRDSF